jgi:hypothetical protein
VPYNAHLHNILYKKVIYIAYSALYSTNLNQNKMVILLAHIGFALWFYVGYKYGKSKLKSE